MELRIYLKDEEKEEKEEREWREGRWEQIDMMMEYE